jgi:hypothetical protein
MIISLSISFSYVYIDLALEGLHIYLGTYMRYRERGESYVAARLPDHGRVGKRWARRDHRRIGLNNEIE